MVGKRKKDLKLLIKFHSGIHTVHGLLQKDNLAFVWVHSRIHSFTHDFATLDRDRKTKKEYRQHQSPCT